jgi:hypothetical protein
MPSLICDTNDARLDRHLDNLERRLPDGVAHHLKRLRRPEARWLRIPSGLILIGGGFLGFLPVLGFWMLPLGLLLLAQDVPMVKRPTVDMLDWAERRWAAWKSSSASS